MGSSWTQNFYHAVYGTKLRTPWLGPKVEERLHPFLGGIAKDLGCTAVAINGMAEHVHVLVRFPSDVAVSNLLRDLKSRSSRWIHQSFPDLREFGWQEGYGGFTVSKSNVGEVEQYIRNQREHHKSIDFETEFLAMLRKTGWEGDPEDVFRQHHSGGLLAARAAPPATIARPPGGKKSSKAAKGKAANSEGWCLAAACQLAGFQSGLLALCSVALCSVALCSVALCSVALFRCCLVRWLARFASCATGNHRPPSGREEKQRSSKAANQQSSKAAK